MPTADATTVVEADPVVSDVPPTQLKETPEAAFAAWLVGRQENISHSPWFDENGQRLLANFLSSQGFVHTQERE